MLIQTINKKVQLVFGVSHIALEFLSVCKMFIVYITEQRFFKMFLTEIFKVTQYCQFFPNISNIRTNDTDKHKLKSN